MSVELYLNPKSEGYSVIQRDLRAELQALQSLTYVETRAPAPPKTLNVEGDVLKFLVDNAQVLGATAATVTIARGLLELVRAIVTRRNVNTAATPPVTIVVNNISLEIPSTPQKEVRFLKRLEGGNASAVPQRTPKGKKSAPEKTTKKAPTSPRAQRKNR